MRSLRLRLFGMWAMSFLACIAVGVLLTTVFQQSTEARVGRAEAIVAHACDLVRDRFGFYAAGWAGAPIDARLRDDLAVAVGLALARQEGVEGGVWQSDLGPLAYAYPTYEGTGPKTDLPAAERDQIQAVNRQALREEQPVARSIVTGAQTLLLEACPLPGPIAGLTGWTMTRVRAFDGLQPVQLGLGVLLALMLAMSAWLGRLLLVWRRRRLGQARQEADDMAARVARAERLAGLGRVAAGMAHEIRNPIAAARLQGENALAGDDARRRRAIGDMLGQIDRLDALVSELLAMTQRVEPHPVAIDLPAFLARALTAHRDQAGARSVILDAQGDGSATFDPAIVGRILDNLLTNAIRHTPPGGSVALVAARADGALTIAVEDTGPGVDPAITDQVFEPFTTTRADGTGLGLAIARELADAHGGHLRLADAHGGRTPFLLELPQP